jgi:hypothetical protein
MKNRILNKFIESTNSIPDSDYGDFMRKENSYFLQMREDLGQNLPQEVVARLLVMQNYLQFNPDWDVDHTRHEILQDAEFLDLYLNLNPQDLMQDNSSHDIYQVSQHL